jgi:multidrug efflux pump subunit AcrA (membrane-fusion protein)
MSPPPAQVTVSRPLDRNVQEWDEYPGRLESKEIVEVRPRVSGYVTSVNFKEGSIVPKGELLYVIDPRPYQAELERAQGEVARAQAQLALAETEFKRTSGLVPTNAASEFELDEKRANRDQAKAAVAVAQANVEAAQLNVEFTHIRAPITGRISRTTITAGNLVNGGGVAGGGSAPGGGSGGGMVDANTLTTITSLDPIYCYVDADETSVLKYQRMVREHQRPDARSGGEVPAMLALLTERDFNRAGTIDFIDNRINPATGTLRARGVFANPNGVMTPGLYARLRVPGGPVHRALLVPELSIQSDQNSKYVMTVDAENTVRITPVTLGAQFGTLRAIVKGLNGDERVIVNGLMRARPGSKVEPQEAPMPGADEETLSTTRIVEPATAPSIRGAAAATTLPATQPSPSPVSSAR